MGFADAAAQSSREHWQPADDQQFRRRASRTKTPRFQYGVMLHPTSAAAAIQSCRHGYRGCIATRHHLPARQLHLPWLASHLRHLSHVRACRHWCTTSERQRSAATKSIAPPPNKATKGGRSRLSIYALSSHQVSAAMPPTCRTRRPYRQDPDARPACSRCRSRRPHRYPANAWPAGQARDPGWSAACPRAGRFRRST